MTSTKQNKGQLKQIIVMIMTSCLLLFILSFMIWLYTASKKENRQTVKNNVTKIQTMLNGLSHLKVKELDALALSIANGPIVQGALSSKHEATITDVLDSIRKKNKLKFVLVLRKRSLLYKSVDDQFSDAGLKQIASGNFIGKSKLPKRSADNLTLLVGRSLTKVDLDFWTEITGATFQIYRDDDKNMISNHSGSTMKEVATDSLLMTSDNEYYKSNKGLLKNTLKIDFYISSKKYRENFKRRRNELIILGASLFFLGLILSLILSEVLFRYLNKNISNNQNEGDFQYLINEIEELKKKQYEL
ncbi:MAG: hypothetical protein KC493_08920 [Bacteriovoracaceae bacterium]|nr:hypothetical protein [Bacteriovoracaceae bacterium]